VKGVLWLGVVGEDMLVCQGRMESVKLLRRGEGDTWTLANEFNISHEGFCKGLTIDTSGGDSTLLVCPSGQSGLMVSRLKDIYIRPVVTLDPDKGRTEAGLEDLTKHGTVMAVSEAGASLFLAVYEAGILLMWDWSNCRVMGRLDVAVIGTPMALVFDKVKGCGVVAGAENKVLSFGWKKKAGSDDTKNDSSSTEGDVKGVQMLKTEEEDGEKEGLHLLKTREIVNPGVGSAGIRQDGKIVATGGWDGRVRVFSWKHPDKLKPLAVLQFHSGSVENITFTQKPPPSGRCNTNLLAAGGKDAKVSLWSIYN